MLLRIAVIIYGLITIVGISFEAFEEAYPDRVAAWLGEPRPSDHEREAPHLDDARMASGYRGR